MTEGIEPKTILEAHLSLNHRDATAVSARLCLRDIAYLQLAEFLDLSPDTRSRLLVFVVRCAISAVTFAVFEDRDLKRKCLEAADNLSGLLKDTNLENTGLTGTATILAARLAVETARCGGSRSRMARSIERAGSYSTASISGSAELKAQLSDDIGFIRNGGKASELLNSYLYDAEAVDNQLTLAVTRFRRTLQHDAA